MQFCDTAGTLDDLLRIKQWGRVEHTIKILGQIRKGQVRISQNETTNQNVSRENEKNSLINVGSQNIYSNLFSNISKKIGTHHFLVHQQFSSYISFCFCKCLLGNCIFILFSYMYIAIYNPGQHLDSANI